MNLGKKMTLFTFSTAWKWVSGNIYDSEQKSFLRKSNLVFDFEEIKKIKSALSRTLQSLLMGQTTQNDRSCGLRGSEWLCIDFYRICCEAKKNNWNPKYLQKANHVSLYATAVNIFPGIMLWNHKNHNL